MDLTLENSKQEADVILELIELKKQKDMFFIDLPPILQKQFQIGLTLIGKAE